MLNCHENVLCCSQILKGLAAKKRILTPTNLSREKNEIRNKDERRNELELL